MGSGAASCGTLLPKRKISNVKSPNLKARVRNVKLGVIPIAGYKPMAPMDTFTVYDNTLTTVENTTGVVILRDLRDIEMHLELFSTLEGYALFGDDARALLAEWSAACRS